MSFPNFLALIHPNNWTAPLASAHRYRPLRLLVDNAGIRKE
jgi:hypothetical protein